jgi:O-succinylbenzoic acid--CoA ligase
MTRARVVRWRISPRGAARGRTTRESVIVEVMRPSGAIGYGEAAPLAPGDSIGAILRGRDTPSARFAFETAALDAEAKERGVPLAKLLGDALPSLPVAAVIDEPRAVEARCIKIKTDGTDLDRLRAIASANPQATLRLDANRSWPRETVFDRMRALADLPIEFIEEPCVDAHELAGAPLPIALDESLVDDPDLTNVAAVVLKPSLLGGFTACRLLAVRARALGKRVIVTHGLEGPIGTAACAALALVLHEPDDAAGLGAHSALDAWDMRVPHIDGATLRALDAPGLGLDDDALEDAIVALRDPLSSSRPVRHRTPVADRCIVATPTQQTIDAVHAALDERRPIALIHHRATASEQARQAALAEEATLDEGDVVLFTSGSTGSARGVVLSRDALIAAAKAHATHLGWQDDDRWYLALSMAHAGGLAVVVRCLAAHRPVELASLERCTLASLVPTQLAAFLDDPAWRPPARLRAILLGGAAAPPALLARATERGVPYLLTYGMTETFGQIATAPREHAGDPRAPLVPLAGVTIEAGTRAEPQRIVVRAPMLATRYLDGAPIAPAFATNDLGFLEGGALHVLGRIDDVIITGGENVHPQQIEAVLCATPGVRGACAFGVADERWGQRVVAAVEIDPTFQLADAVAHWRSALPAHARPRALATVGSLPCLPNGKLDRRAAAQLPRTTV